MAIEGMKNNNTLQSTIDRAEICAKVTRLHPPTIRRRQHLIPSTPSLVRQPGPSAEGVGWGRSPEWGLWKLSSLSMIKRRCTFPRTLSLSMVGGRFRTPPAIPHHHLQDNLFDCFLSDSVVVVGDKHQEGGVTVVLVVDYRGPFRLPGRETHLNG